ncbi:MAG: Gfo/Idh/MocA family oxidoreductase [Cytophagales bacterium]|nr:Gfo/Idh/MocA family oxidoreductase [Cytophagales bacterium]
MQFALTGVAGYIAPRHLQAIKNTGHTLVAALDPHDSVGVLDSYFPDCNFFTEPERFDRHLYKLRKEIRGISYLSICSPNYLHDAHIRMALRNGAHAICEKPLVLYPHNLDMLHELEIETAKNVYTVLQLRHHPQIINLKKQYANTTTHHQVKLEYITSRGNWYRYSWKGNEERSGGILANIGIHFFDMLIWIFGQVQACHITSDTNTCITGMLELAHATVQWTLSIDKNDLPSHIINSNIATYRKIEIDGTQQEFSDGFGDLHTVVYESILSGQGFGIEDARPSIEVVHKLRLLLHK